MAKQSPMSVDKKAKDKTTTKLWVSRKQDADTYQESMFQKFSSWYDLMYAHINSSQYALWRSKVFIPIIPSKAWSMVAKLTSLNPGFEVSLYGDALLDEKAQEKAEKAQWKLEHDWDNPHFDEPIGEKLFGPLVDAVVTGTGLAKVPWTYGDRVRYEKHMNEDGSIDFEQDDMITTSIGHNDLIPVDIMSVSISPGAKNLQSAPWIIIEDFVSYEQLKTEQDASGGTLYDKAALAKTKDFKTGVDKFADEKKARSQLISDDDPLAKDSTVKKFARWECYEKTTGYIYVFAVSHSDGGKDLVELNCRQNPYWHGKYPLVPFYVKRRPHHFWGQGVFEDTERLQSAFNDLFNHYMDNLNLSLDGMVMKQEGDNHEYIVEPGGEYLYKNQKPEQFKFPEPNAQQFNTIMQFLGSQVEDATISSYASGTPNSASDKTSGTASGIMRLQEAAGDKIGFMRKSYSSTLREVGRQWLSNNQQFLDQEVVVMGQENNLPAPVKVAPADLQGEMTLRINDASMEPQTKEQKMEEQNAYMTQMMQMSQASIAQAQATQGGTQPMYLDFTALAQDYSLKSGRADFDKVIITQEDIDTKLAEEQAKQEALMMQQGIDPDSGLPLEDMNGSEEAAELPGFGGAGSEISEPSFPS